MFYNTVRVYHRHRGGAGRVLSLSVHFGIFIVWTLARGAGAPVEDRHRGWSLALRYVEGDLLWWGREPFADAVREAQHAGEGTSVEVAFVCTWADEAAKKPCKPVVARLTGSYMDEAEWREYRLSSELADNTSYQ
mgnify:CR=1 FL=1